ncbi:MAG: hypothetical protein ACP5EN_10770 [Rhodovulum sp.]
MQRHAIGHLAEELDADIVAGQAEEHRVIEQVGTAQGPFVARIHLHLDIGDGLAEVPVARVELQADRARSVGPDRKRGAIQLDQRHAHGRAAVEHDAAHFPGAMRVEHLRFGLCGGDALAAGHDRRRADHGRNRFGRFPHASPRRSAYRRKVAESCGRRMAGMGINPTIPMAR